jgi:hypothetical protein
VVRVGRLDHSLSLSLSSRHPISITTYPGKAHDEAGVGVDQELAAGGARIGGGGRGGGDRAHGGGVATGRHGR